MIVIPMVGLSSRFFKKGYTKPKYMLTLNEKSVFEHSVSSFSYYFKTLPFLFIVRSDFDTPAFVEQEVKQMGIADYRIIVLNTETKGQAETVFMGLSRIDYSGDITIFNIDTFRPDFRLPAYEKDGFVEVFKGEGDNWSYAKPIDGSTLIAEMAEKNRISDLCCTGLYHFSSTELFFDAYQQQLKTPATQWQAGELYVAPLYNFLLSKGYKFSYNLIDSKDVIFCGIPEEYEQLKVDQRFM
tara:strand:- start:4273 stop:4995 length:723 start_codon:yes stop_codon:yes gene_type:complete